MAPFYLHQWFLFCPWSVFTSLHSLQTKQSFQKVCRVEVEKSKEKQKGSWMSAVQKDIKQKDSKQWVSMLKGKLKKIFFNN